MICANAPLTIKAVKIHRRRNRSRTNASAMCARHDEMVEQCFASSDYNEGRTAFMEKRKPVFTGT